MVRLHQRLKTGMRSLDEKYIVTGRAPRCPVTQYSPLGPSIHDVNGLQVTSRRLASEISNLRAFHFSFAKHLLFSGVRLADARYVRQSDV